MKRKNDEVTLETCKRKYTNDNGESNMLQTILELQTELNESKEIVTWLWSIIKTLHNDPKLSDQSNSEMMDHFIDCCKSGLLEGVKSCNLNWISSANETKNDTDSFNEVPYTYCEGLYYATKNNYTNIVELLTYQIQNPYTRKRVTDYVQYYDFHQACSTNNYEKVRQLLLSCSQDEKDKMISSAYHYAFHIACTYFGYGGVSGVKLVQLLLDNTSPELSRGMLTYCGCQTFVSACTSKNDDIMQLLVDRMEYKTFAYAWSVLKKQRGSDYAYHMLTKLSLETIDRATVVENDCNYYMSSK